METIADDYDDGVSLEGLEESIARRAKAKANAAKSEAEAAKERKRERNREWRRKNPEKMREIRRRWNEKQKKFQASHPEEFRAIKRRHNAQEKAKECRKRWRLEHKEQVKKTEAERRLRNLERINEKQKEWRASHPESAAASARRSNERVRKLRPWAMYPRNAAQRGRAWSLSEQEATAIMSQPCHYCGVRGEPYIGIDRKDNDGHYELANCLPCCKMCNYAKRTHTYDAFQSWLDRIAAFRFKAQEEGGQEGGEEVENME